jgi:E3 ubiquitin-protein ligase UBR1
VNPDGPRSDNFLVAIIHLLHTAVTIESMKQISVNSHSNGFIQNVSSLQFEINISDTETSLTKSLLSLILDIIDRESEDEFKEHVNQLALLVIRLAAISSSALVTIQSWRNSKRLDLHVDSKASLSMETTADDKEKKKLAAKQRQAAIMAQFAQQQKEFLENFGSEEDDDEDFIDDILNVDDESKHGSGYVPDERQYHLSVGNCIVCQEGFTKDGPMFGMLVLMQETCISRNRFVNFEEPESIANALKIPRSLDVEQDRNRPFVVSPTVTHGMETTSLPSPLPPSSTDFEVHTSSCGHMMHIKCFTTYIESVERRQLHELRRHPECLERNEFLCPLCKSLGNCLFPILSSQQPEYVNWSGSISGTAVGPGYVPDDKGKTKNVIFSIENWWNSRAKLAIEKFFSASKDKDVKLEEFLTISEGSKSAVAISYFTSALSKVVESRLRSAGPDAVPELLNTNLEDVTVFMDRIVGVIKVSLNLKCYYIFPVYF